jgi:SAM-dependent methyltransferase
MHSAQQMYCTLCGEAIWNVQTRSIMDYLTGQFFDIVQCRSCGLKVTNPFPNAIEIGEYYPARYRGNRHSFTERVRTVLRRRAIESYFPRGFKGRLLDVGCGDGAFALEMRRRGWVVSATEIDRATVKRLRANGVDAKSPEEAERLGFEGLFDAVTCWHVMEHVEQPLRTAKWIKSLLKPEGVFQVTVPNAASLQARVFGRKWLHLDVPRHRYHFTRLTLGSLLCSASFQQVRSTCFALEYDWFGVIQSALNYICSRPNALFEKLMSGNRQNSEPLKGHTWDTVISLALAPAIAGLSLPPLLLGWLCGDGATLTLTCNRGNPILSINRHAGGAPLQWPLCFGPERCIFTRQNQLVVSSTFHINPLRD